MPKDTVCHLSANSQPTVGCLSGDCWATVGRQLVDHQPTVGQQTANIWLTVNRQSADRRPTVSRQFSLCCRLLPLICITQILNIILTFYISIKFIVAFHVNMLQQPHLPVNSINGKHEKMPS